MVSRVITNDGEGDVLEYTLQKTKILMLDISLKDINSHLSIRGRYIYKFYKSKFGVKYQQRL